MDDICISRGFKIYTLFKPIEIQLGDQSILEKTNQKLSRGKNSFSLMSLRSVMN